MTLTAFFGQLVKGPSTPPPAPRQSSVDLQEAPSAVKVAPPKGVVKKVKATSHAKTKKASSTPTKKGVSGKRKPAKMSKSSKVVMVGKGSVTSEWRLLKQVGLKSPKSAYTLWAGENRKRIGDGLGTTKFSDVSKAVGEAWKLLTEEQKKPYYENAKLLKNKYQEARKAYDEYLTTTIKRDTKARETKRKHGGPKVVIRHLSKGQMVRQPVKVKTTGAKRVKKTTASPPKPQSLSSMCKTTSTNTTSTEVVSVQDEDVKQIIEPTPGLVEAAAVAQVTTPVKRTMNSFRIPKDVEPAPSEDIPAPEDIATPEEQQAVAEDEEVKSM